MVSRDIELMMTAPKAIVAIGASAGGVDVLREVVAGLPGDLDAAVFVTLHIGAHRSDLPWLLSRAGPLPASHPVDGETIRAGHVYVAPPDHHMLVEPGHISLTKGPRENWSRPAIDPLLRSAARAYGPDVIGVILTGRLNDGTAGMYEVKARHGITVVQDPAEAVTPNMPQSVIDNVVVDHIVPVDRIAALLTRLVADRQPTRPDATPPTGDSQEQGMTAEFTLNHPVAVTCPDCGGALRQSALGKLTQYSCHIGHVYTAQVMMSVQFLTMERALEKALRSLGERAELCREMSAKLADDPDGAAEARQWDAARDEALDQTAPLRTLLTRPWIHPAESSERHDKRAIPV